MGGGMNYPFYYEYYASQAFFQSDVKAWEEWNRRNLKRLKAAWQTVDGGWESQNGSSFSTAAALLHIGLELSLSSHLRTMKFSLILLALCVRMTARV